jgi:hypothetical protein
MPKYSTFTRFSLDPQNEQEVLEKAITRAFQASSGKLNAFNAGSPLVVLLESLVFTQMEWLFWLNSMPEAMVLTYIAEVLGAGRNYGSKAKAVLVVTLTKPLTSSFILNAGTKVYSNINADISYELVNNFIIAPGQVVGYAQVEATEVGQFSSVGTDELTVVAENFAYLKSVTNLAASTLGSDFESLVDTAERVQALMSQTTPVSALDWLNVIEGVYPDKLAEVQNYDGVLYLYIQDYTQNLLFEAYCYSVKGLLQSIQIEPYKKALLQIRIEPEITLPSEDCLSVAKGFSAYLNKAKPLQAIDLYKKLVDFLPSINLKSFDVLYYYTGITPESTTGINLQPYDFVGGQLLKELFTGNYYLVNSSFNTVVSAFDEAEIGYLSYHPVYTNLGPGNYSGGDIVKIGPTYYLIQTSGSFDPATTTNWSVLLAPVAWANNLSLGTSDFVLQNGTIPGLSHGFIPQFAYTTANTVDSNLVQITPLSKAIGQSVAPGEYFYRQGFDEVIYYNNLAVNYLLDPLTLNTVNQVTVLQKPNVLYSKLTRRSKFTIGDITTDNNYIYTSSTGNKVGIATGLAVPASVQYPEPLFGTFIKSGGEIYEVLEAFIPLSTDTIQSLLTAKLIKKAYRKYEDYEVISTQFTKPFYFDIEFVYFDQEIDIVVSKDSTLGTYSIS